MTCKRTVVITFFLLAILFGSTGLWLRAQRRQYALNRVVNVAVEEGNDTKALALLNEGADPNTQYAASTPSLLQLLKQLLHRSPPSSSDSETRYDRRTAFVIACDSPSNYNGPWPNSDWPYKVKLLKAMLTHGADVNVADESGRTPLMMVAFPQGSDLVRLFLAHGADVNAQDNYGRSALDWAAIFNDKTNIRQLQAHGAKFRPGR